MLETAAVDITNTINLGASTHVLAGYWGTGGEVGGGHRRTSGSKVDHTRSPATRVSTGIWPFKTRARLRFRCGRCRLVAFSIAVVIAG